MKNELATVIVVNYNGEKIIKKCVDNILAQTYSPTEVIVVDNNSQDKSLEIIKQYQNLHNFKLIKSDRNIGCPGARNAALKFCRGKYAAFMDNDGFADKNWLFYGIKKLESDQNIAAVAPLVLFEKEKNIINGIGGFINEEESGEDYFYKKPLSRNNKYPEHPLWPMGCGMIIKSEVFKKQRFDEILFNYYDDIDIGIKIWCSGKKIAAEPKAAVYHLHSQSDTYNNNKKFLCERNRIYTYLKYLPLNLLLFWFLREIIRDIKRTKKYGLNYFSIWRWNVKHIKAIIYHRKNYNAKKIFPNLEI